MPSERCELCRFFRKFLRSNDLNDRRRVEGCRRYPQGAVGLNGGDWCGEFEAKESPTPGGPAVVDVPGKWPLDAYAAGYTAGYREADKEWGDWWTQQPP